MPEPGGPPRSGRPLELSSSVPDLLGSASDGGFADSPSPPTSERALSMEAEAMARLVDSVYFGRAGELGANMTDNDTAVPMDQAALRYYREAVQVSVTGLYKRLHKQLLITAGFWCTSNS